MLSTQEDHRSVRSRLQETVEDAGQIFLLHHMLLRTELDRIQPGPLQALYPQALQIYTCRYRGSGALFGAVRGPADSLAALERSPIMHKGHILRNAEIPTAVQNQKLSGRLGV